MYMSWLIHIYIKGTSNGHLRSSYLTRAVLVPWLIHIYFVTHSYMSKVVPTWKYSHSSSSSRIRAVQVPWLIHMYSTTHLYIFIVTHWYMWKVVSTFGSTPIRDRLLSKEPNIVSKEPYMFHDSFIHALPAWTYYHSW